ncbi:SCP-like extracellular protein [Proteiniborus sp. DW1]|uniref:CAP domain-containing protein n=1 Tax=Proteiniborus sp. DW1 TaxID=1889883 RepID=UPI00092DFAA9|nr:CAP domain-containing protein [Proteiniborus sp. DW1]SCG82521.1 SCP-like extracellular protein [Proteiniborus sp. DW1]
MKRNLKRVKVVSTLAALLVLSNINIANAASYRIVTTNNQNCTWTTNKTYTFRFSSYLKNNGNVIKVPAKGDVVNTEKPVQNETPKTEAPKTETPKTEAPKQEETKTEAPVDQPSNSTEIGSVSAIEQEVVRLVNVERQKNGLNALELDAELSKVAREKSKDMATKGYFSHTSPTYGSPFDMMKKFGIKYSSAGENIAMGQPTAEAVVKAWMNSEGHRANILNKNFTKIGVGYYKASNGSPYWTQMFIRP